MKNFKNLLSVLVLTIIMVGSFNANAQKANNPEGYSLEIPQEFQISDKAKKSVKLLTASKYDKTLGGYVYVTGYVDQDGSVKLASILTPNQMRISGGCTGGNYQSCAMDCTNKPTTAGVLLCTGYCMISCSNIQQ